MKTRLISIVSKPIKLFFFVVPFLFELSNVILEHLVTNLNKPQLNSTDLN